MVSQPAIAVAVFMSQQQFVGGIFFHDDYPARVAGVHWQWEQNAGPYGRTCRMARAS
jgi:hypothetical protein